MRTLALGLLWVLFAPDPQGDFGSAAACGAEVAAWQSRTRQGEQWVARRHQEALQQTNPAVAAFWLQSERMAAREVE
jgi:hypothetical protein